MEIRQVRYFMEVAAGGSFNQAAARLHLTQPAVSRQIKALEEELGAKMSQQQKYGVPYFLAESEAKQSGPRKEAVGARARSGRGFKWRAPTRSVGRRPFKPQTALLHRRTPVGSM